MKMKLFGTSGDEPIIRVSGECSDSEKLETLLEKGSKFVEESLCRQ
jgi:phosphomannomutase